MNDCPRPLDPIDCEALASGDEPILAADASSHAILCASCGASVREARAFLAQFEAVSPASPKAPPASIGGDLADRVVRIRPFSRRERRDWRLWAPPAGFAGLMFAAGFGILASPGLSARDQAGLGLAVLAPVAGLARAAARAFSEVFTASPAAWEALAQSARRQVPLGLAALLLLAPAGFALVRVLARSGSGARRG